jgi:hypothetical protein
MARIRCRLPRRDCDRTPAPVPFPTLELTLALLRLTVQAPVETLIEPSVPVRNEHQESDGSGGLPDLPLISQAEN